jgi:hypothetical protein
MSVGAGGTRAGERFLGAVYLAAAVVALPLTLFFGFLVAPVLLIGVVWLAAVGVRLIAGSPAAVTQARRTAIVAAPLALLIGVYGLFALRAAARSAERGGGLLGAFGLIPLLLALVLLALSGLTPLLARRP